MFTSSNNTIIDNTANSNTYQGIYLSSSSGNTITNNTANSNPGEMGGGRGIHLDSSSSNIISNNTANSNSDYGIRLYFSSNNTIIDNTANSNSAGITIESSSNSNTIIDNTASNNDEHGIRIESSNYNALTNNVANSNSATGIYLSSSNNNTLTNNDLNGWRKNRENDHYYRLTPPMNWSQAEAKAEEWGGHLVTVNNEEENLWLRNQFGTDENFWIGFNDIDAEGNWVWSSGEPVTYTNWWADEPNNCGIPECLPEDAAVMNFGGCERIDGEWFCYYGDGWNDIPTNGQGRGIVEADSPAFEGTGIRLDYSSSNTITNNNASNNYDGIYLSSSSSNTVTNNNASNNYVGISLESSSSNTITNNNASSNVEVGIKLNLSDSNTLSDNTVDYTERGIRLCTSHYNILTNNIVEYSNRSGIKLNASSTYNALSNNIASNNKKNGIVLAVGSNYNTISNNTVNSNNKSGIVVKLASNYNTIANNNASSNIDWGIGLWDSSNNNTIYNNYFNNTNNAWDDSVNYWNTTKTPGTNVIGGPYLGGNFWAYPNGTGFSEQCTDVDSDGICDSSYTLASGNVDYLPLAIKTTFNISLNQDWNLISVPLEQDNWNITSVLAPIDGNYTVVFAYIDDVWEKSTAARDPLTNMSLEYGYWIYMNVSDTLELSGTVPATTTINIVGPGWNLAGYPSFTTRNITDVLSGINYTVVFAYIDDVWEMTTAARDPLAEMTPGLGYWIYANEAGSYEVGN